MDHIVIYNTIYAFLFVKKSLKMRIKTRLICFVFFIVFYRKVLDGWLAKVVLLMLKKSYVELQLQISEISSQTISKN